MVKVEQKPGEEDRVMMCWLPISDLQGESDLFEMVFNGLEKPKELPVKGFTESSDEDHLRYRA